MILFKCPMWPQGPNLLAAAIYNRKGWHTLFLFPLELRAVALRLPVRVRMFQ